MSTWAYFVARGPAIWARTQEHVALTLMAMAAAAVVGIALGLVLSRQQRAAGPVIGLVGIFQTIPSLALLGFLLPVLGIGTWPAVVALFLYALLPIVRNTYAGITGVAPAVRDAARGMGLTPTQIRWQVELPLALPVIFAGLRTATVINIGVATLCSLIGAGGLGDFIFRGIQTNNTPAILAGAIPAALLALLFDGLLGFLQRRLEHRSGTPKRRNRGLVVASMGLLAALTLTLSLSYLGVGERRLRAGFPSEFMERPDGWPGLQRTYGLDFAVREMDPGLMYIALAEGEVDVISGFTTDGRIVKYDLLSLADDRAYFPPYYAAPFIRQEALATYPVLDSLLGLLAGRLTEADMRRLNYLVDEDNRSPRAVAESALDSLGIHPTAPLPLQGSITIGSKNFTEQYILAQLMAGVLRRTTTLDVKMKTGLGSATIAHEALLQGAIDLYPEYSGTALLVLNQPSQAVRDSLLTAPDAPAAIHAYNIRRAQQEDLTWLAPFGFENNFALMMRRADARASGYTCISHLAQPAQE